MQTNPNIYDVQYTRCNSNSQSAARIVRYLRRRPLDKEHPGPESEWRELDEDQQFGDAEAFKREAQRRKRERLRSAQERGKDISQDHSPKNVSYMHIVLSPSSREEFGNEDFGALLDPWIRDEQGRMHEHYGAIHRDDPEGPKIHLVVARDRIHKTRELPRMKERTAEIIQERERAHEKTRESEPDRSEQRERKEALHMQPDPEEQRTREAEAEREATSDTKREAVNEAERDVSEAHKGTEPQDDPADHERERRRRSRERFRDRDDDERDMDPF